MFGGDHEYYIDWYGLDRFALEHWIRSHPSLDPCDVAGIWTGGVDSDERANETNLTWSMAPNEPMGPNYKYWIFNRWHRDKDQILPLLMLDTTNRCMNTFWSQAFSTSGFISTTRFHHSSRVYCHGFRMVRSGNNQLNISALTLLQAFQGSTGGRIPLLCVSELLVDKSAIIHVGSHETGSSTLRELIYHDLLDNLAMDGYAVPYNIPGRFSHWKSLAIVAFHLQSQH
jgi:hypothetical protein